MASGSAYSFLFQFNLHFKYSNSKSLDLAQHVFTQHNVSALRRVRKSDNNRIALAVGATIVNRIEDLREADVGTGCGLFEVEKIGDECVAIFRASSSQTYLMTLLSPLQVFLFPH